MLLTVTHFLTCLVTSSIKIFFSSICNSSCKLNRIPSVRTLQFSSCKLVMDCQAHFIGQYAKSIHFCLFIWLVFAFCITYFSYKLSFIYKKYIEYHHRLLYKIFYRNPVHCRKGFYTALEFHIDILKNRTKLKRWV